MKVIRLTFVVVLQFAICSATSPFVKAALGFRLGYSPTEHGYNQKVNYGAEKKGVGVQLLSGTNSGGGGWHQGALQAAGSGYGAANGYGSGYDVGIGGRGVGGAREGPLAAHVGHGAVRHLRILGLNLYLGGRAAHIGHGLQQHKSASKPTQGFHFPGIKLFGIRPSVHIGAKPSGAPHTVGATTGLRAAVGTHDYGVGFKVGYRQGVNTKTIAQVLGLGSGAPQGKYSYVPTTHKGQDQVYVHGNSLLKGHGHNHQYGGFGQSDSPVAGLESKHHFNTQPLQQLGSQIQQLQPLQGPIRFPYQHSRTILRPTPIQYTFNGPQQALQSGPVRMVYPLASRGLPPHPQQQYRPNNGPFSTIFPQPAASNYFINPLPQNGQPLSKLQDNLRASAQNQVPYQQYHGFHQNNFQQHPYSQQHQLPQQYNLFQSPVHSFQHPSQVQEQGYRGTGGAGIQEQPLPSNQQPLNSNFPPNFPLSEVPFTADSMQFQPEKGFHYTSTDTVTSDPVNIGSYMFENTPPVPVGPLGRRLKKTKRPRDVIIKKSDTFYTKDLETSASSNNAILMASSLGATSWTPLVMVDNAVVPKLSKKSLETPASIPEKKEQEAVIKPNPQSQQVGAAVSVVPTVSSSTPVDYSQDRSMILKKRRLNVSGEVTGFFTTIPSTTTTAAPSTTSALPLSSSSSTPSSSPPSSSIAPSSSMSTSPPSSSTSSSLTTVFV